MRTTSSILIRLASLAMVLAGPVSRAQVISLGGRPVIPVDALTEDDESEVTFKAVGRSWGGQLAGIVQRSAQNGTALVPLGTPGFPGEVAHGQGPNAGLPGPDTQVNDPALDNIVQFPPSLRTRPFENSIQSETSLVNHGRDLVVGYNSLAGITLENFPPSGIFITRLLASAYSISHDGGATWKSGFVPPVSQDVPFTFGDPSLASDRQGRILYASLGTDASFNPAVIVNVSEDQGDTWTQATVVAVDPGSDKDWIAIGPDPRHPTRDNAYVTWTHFNDPGTGVGQAELWFSRSTDGGASWSAPRALFAPVDDGVNSSVLQFTNPVVDPVDGRLYIPFLHLSHGDADNVRMLVSDDGGDSFHLVAFAAPGAVDTFAFPNVSPGTFTDCTRGGIRAVLHQGPSVATGRFGLPVYAQATRIVSQPSAAAVGGRIVIALNSSTSPALGDPAAGSSIRVLYSADGGNTWATPLTVAPSTTATPHHIHPAITLDALGLIAWVAYYAQGSDERLRTEIARIQLTGNHLTLRDVSPLSSVSFDLTPSNVLVRRSPVQTSNYDQVFVTCYDLGEYMAVQAGPFLDTRNRVSAAWGENRRSWTGPPGSVAPYTHAQPDVFFGRVSAR